jgi:hypothetical protein
LASWCSAATPRATFSISRRYRARRYAAQADHRPTRLAMDCRDGACRGKTASWRSGGWCRSGGRQDGPQRSAHPAILPSASLPSLPTRNAKLTRRSNTAGCSTASSCRRSSAGGSWTLPAATLPSSTTTCARRRIRRTGCWPCCPRCSILPSHGLAARWIEPLPADRKIRRAQARERMLLSVELARLGDALASFDGSPYALTAVKLLVFTGARGSRRRAQAQMGMDRFRPRRGAAARQQDRCEDFAPTAGSPRGARRAAAARRQPASDRRAEGRCCTGQSRKALAGDSRGGRAR